MYFESYSIEGYSDEISQAEIWTDVASTFEIHFSILCSYLPTPLLLWLNALGPALNKTKKILDKFTKIGTDKLFTNLNITGQSISLIQFEN